MDAGTRTNAGGPVAGLPRKPRAPGITTVHKTLKPAMATRQAGKGRNEGSDGE